MTTLVEARSSTSPSSSLQCVHPSLIPPRQMTLVDLLHYPLSPSDGIGDGSYGSRNPRSAVVLRQFASRKDTGGDQQHALPTLIHEGKHITKFRLVFALKPC
jgi:hypothetical protein